MKKTRLKNRLKEVGGGSPKTVTLWRFERCWWHSPRCAPGQAVVIRPLSSLLRRHIQPPAHTAPTGPSPPTCFSDTSSSVTQAWLPGIWERPHALMETSRTYSYSKLKQTQPSDWEKTKTKKKEDTWVWIITYIRSFTGGPSLGLGGTWVLVDLLP